MPATASSRPGRRPDPALREQQWRQRLPRFERSARSVPAFCATEGVSPPSFYSWRRRLRQPPAADSRRPARAASANAASSSATRTPTA
jgi:hypothetical protein